MSAEGSSERELSGVERLVMRLAEQRRLGPFSLTRRLGKGSFAPVWLARETYGATTLRQVALKLFSLPCASSPFEKSRALEAIVAEAGALCRVEHANVVRFYALPIDEPLGVVGLAMEYVDGVSLEQRLEAEALLPLAETVAVGRALASALAAVHRAGLVHRDLKPGNVVSTAAVYKLIDFGVAAADTSRPSPQTLPALDLRDGAKITTDVRLASFGSVVCETPRGAESTVALDVHCGTMGYIDPKCIASGVPATPASDLYALGATLFRCLVGCVPAQAADGCTVSNAILRGTKRPPPLAKLLPAVPRPLAALVDDLLEPERAARPACADAVLERLEQIDWLLGTKRSAPSRAPARPVEIFDGVGVRALGNVLIVVHASAGRLQRARFYHDRLEQLAAQTRGDIVCLLVLPATADPPDTETRLEYARRFPRHTALRRFVTVAVGDEFWHKVVQGVTHGMNQAHGHSCMFVSADTIPRGVATLLETDHGGDQVEAGGSAREQSPGVSPERVIAAVHEVCRALNVLVPE